MDKTRDKIFVGCLALLLVMVVGYALFSQNLTISGTAKAEGNFSLTMTCTTGILDEIKDYDADYGSESGYSNDSCTVNEDTATFYTDLAYPTARRYFTVKVVNTGTITATDKDLDVMTQTSLNAENTNCQYKSSDDSLVKCIRANGNDLTNSKMKYIKKTKDGEISYLTNHDKLSLEPGDTFYLALGITWPSQFQTNIYETGEWYFKLNRTYTLDFVQATN